MPDRTSDKLLPPFWPCCAHCGCKPGDRTGHGDTCIHRCNDDEVDPPEQRIATGGTSAYDRALTEARDARDLRYEALKERNVARRELAAALAEVASLRADVARKNEQIGAQTPNAGPPMPDAPEGAINHEYRNPTPEHRQELERRLRDYDGKPLCPCCGGPDYLPACNIVGFTHQQVCEIANYSDDLCSECDKESQ